MARRARVKDGTRSLPVREAELAARWAAGAWRGATLQALSGATYRLVFEGRRNGGPGPDFRDAALETEDGARLLGDVELHLRARDWLAHGHHADARYNRVILYVALDAASSFSPLANGGGAPVVRLSFTQAALHTPDGWPCANLPTRIGSMALRALLLWAGTERFERRAHAFADELAHTAPESGMGELRWTAADRILWLALAEALGYGQHREALRQAGMRLLASDPPDLEHMSRSERRRLVALLALWERWRATGPWEPLRAALVVGPATVAAALRVSGGSVSAARARIMAANVVFPFAAALGAQGGDTTLVERARAVYLECPGLPSNQITREMLRQLGLTKHPLGAVAQQGLHHLWAGWCYAKDCARCPCNAHRGAHRQSQADTV